MNPRWLMIRRLRGPAFFLTFAVTAVLHQWDILSFGESWPLYLIVAGVLTLLERGALASTPYDPGPYAPGSYPGSYPNPGPYQQPGQPYPQGWGQPNAQPPATSTAIVTTGPTDITHEGNK
jgi:hypothetical protein